ncbi:hypothetical protein [Lysobacter changpingensis]|uniref:hypothetical protein n=1 Tax=Lysobacter changpingensis TaxID=2792784 RepID=UPI001A8FA47F|nr:hypothetical protein [Lysobacter changpingensis]
MRRIAQTRHRSERFMTTRCNAAADAAVTPVAIPQWPGLRHADLIERSLRLLGGARREALLEAVAHALDRYVAGTTQRTGTACIDLDAELDEVLRRLGPTGAARPVEGAIA